MRGQTDIGKEEVNAVLEPFTNGQRLFSCRGCDDLKPIGFQTGAQYVANGGLIINQQYARLGIRHGNLPLLSYPWPRIAT